MTSHEVAEAQVFIGVDEDDHPFMHIYRKDRNPSDSIRFRLFEESGAFGGDLVASRSSKEAFRRWADELQP